MSRARVGLVGYGYHSPKRTLRGHESAGTAIGEGESPAEDILVTCHTPVT
jgi:hypothetical protein